MPNSLTKRILVIDNEPASTRLVRLTLERHGAFEVLELNEPSRALSTAGVFRPDLILLDVEMPSVDGGEVARRLRTVPGLKKVPIVFMTGLLKDDEATAQVCSGGSHVLSKPVTIAKLVACVGDLLGTLCHAQRADGAQITVAI